MMMMEKNHPYIIYLKEFFQRTNTHTHEIEANGRTKHSNQRGIREFCNNDILFPSS